MHPDITVRALRETDRQAWQPLWDAYNAFYGREGPTALDPAVTLVTWQRFFDANEPVFALLAQVRERVVGLTHFLYHRSTTRIEPTCYLQDLFTAPDARGQGVARALIEAVCSQAMSYGIKRVYWQTHESNAAGRMLYDKVAKHHGFIVYARDA
jgi:GNAT superfamily N-acetyltransferase